MGKVIILESTTKNPISLMGERAGVCWGSDITDPKKNYRRGQDCLESGHGRVLEFVNIEMVLDGYSARVIREWYTHLGGSPTRLQASTRYIDYEDFEYILPPSAAKNEGAKAVYEDTMKTISEATRKLEKEYGIPREDAALLLPLGMSTKIVDKRNVRNLIDMSHQRLCTRTYWEYRALMHDVMAALSAISPEWEEIVSKYFVPKCELTGFCPEKKSCGRRPKKEAEN